MECALAASLCTLILGLTSEGPLAQYPGFGPAGLHAVFTLVLMNLERCQRVSILYVQTLRSYFTLCNLELPQSFLIITASETECYTLSGAGREVRGTC